MRRDIKSLSEQEFDVLVIGAGIHGACVARDAALRGLKVALIDKGDLNNATSHNSLKTIHGGIRYLQHLNLKRTIESIREQSIWLKTAPDLVKPLPFMMPTYGWRMRGPLVMYLGIRMFETIGWLMRRNRSLDSSRRVSRGKVISRDKMAKDVSYIKEEGLTGGALWYDAQVVHADKAVLQICQDAEDHGAQIANYVKAEALDFEEGRVRSAKVTDLVTGSDFEISAKYIVNAAGPWASKVLTESQLANAELDSMSLTKSMNLVTKREAPEFAISAQSQIQSDSKIDKSKRLYFLGPGQGQAMFGTTHFPYRDEIDQLSYQQSEIEDFVEQINTAFPGYNLDVDEVTYCYQGLTPAEHDSNGNSVRSHHSKVVDCGDSGSENLISIVSIKWTTARLVAEQAVDLLLDKMGLDSKCKTHTRHLPNLPSTSDCFLNLDSDKMAAEIKRHVEHTMVFSLVDLLTRRTDEFVQGKVSADRIREAGNILADIFNWNSARKQLELQRVLTLWMPLDLKHELTNTPFWL
jgi:glycerol-3-phosphate dehydrogenase